MVDTEVVLFMHSNFGAYFKHELFLWPPNRRSRYFPKNRVPVLVKKLAKRPISKVGQTPEVVSVQVVRRPNVKYNVSSDTFRNKDDLCKSNYIECGVFNKTRTTRRSVLCSLVL